MVLYSRSYQRESSDYALTSGEEYYFPGPTVRRMTAEQVWDSILTLAVHNRAFLSSSVSAVLCLSGVAVRQFWDELRQIQGWQGLVFYLIGLAWLVIGVFASRIRARRLSRQQTQRDDDPQRAPG